MTTETKIRLFNYSIEVAKDKGVDLSSLLWSDVISEMHESICTTIENYINEYDEEFCLLDKLGKDEFTIYIDPFRKFFPLCLITYLEIKKSHPEYKSVYIQSLSHEYIASEFDRYMEIAYHFLRNEDDYSREDKKRLEELKERRTVEGIEEQERYYTQLMESNERVYFYDGDPFLICFTPQDVELWDSVKDNEEERLSMFNTYYLAGIAQPFRKFPDECEIYKIKYLNKLSWQEHISNMKELQSVSEE